jgi:hypothetical protein
MERVVLTRGGEAAPSQRDGANLLHPGTQGFALTLLCGYLELFSRRSHFASTSWENGYIRSEKIRFPGLGQSHALLIREVVNLHHPDPRRPIHPGQGCRIYARGKR